MKLPMHFDWDPVTPARTAKIPPDALRTTVPSLCRRAGIPVRATVDRPVYVYRGRKKIRTPAFDLVGVPVAPRSREGAMRALEKLAYSFFDHCARYCVCGRGYFVAEEPGSGAK